MNPSEFARELVSPLTTPTVLFSWLLFFVFVQIGLFGLYLFEDEIGIVIGMVLVAQLAVIVLPALLRTLMHLLEARSLGQEPPPPVVEFFSWVGHTWALFPLAHVATLCYLFYKAPLDIAFAVTLVYLLVLPASLVILAVTHSVRESLRPRALYELVKRAGFSYLIAPLFLLAAVGVIVGLRRVTESDLLVEFLAFYCLFAAFAIFGGMVRRLNLQNEIEIPTAMHVVAAEHDEQQALVRRAALNHAYGLVSRGNRTGGLEHLYSEINDDPNSDDAWFWYFDQLLRWERDNAGLTYAQNYLHHLLRHGDLIRAVKVMLRCRLVNPAFKPMAEDIPQAIAAAEACHNDELANFLR